MNDLLSFFLLVFCLASLFIFWGCGGCVLVCPRGRLCRQMWCQDSDRLRLLSASVAFIGFSNVDMKQFHDARCWWEPALFARLSSRITFFSRAFSRPAPSVAPYGGVTNRSELVTKAITFLMSSQSCSTLFLRLKSDNDVCYFVKGSFEDACTPESRSGSTTGICRIDRVTSESWVLVFASSTSLQVCVLAMCKCRVF